MTTANLYYSVFADGATDPTGPEIVSGLSWANCVAAGNAVARDTDGIQSFDQVAGLAPGDYRCAFVVSDGVGYSNVAVSDVETVTPPGEFFSPFPTFRPGL